MTGIWCDVYKENCSQWIYYMHMDFNYIVRDANLTSFKYNFQNCLKLFSSKKNLEAYWKNEHKSRHTGASNITKENDAIENIEKAEIYINDTVFNSQNITNNE